MNSCRRHVGQDKHHKEYCILSAKPTSARRVAMSFSWLMAEKLISLGGAAFVGILITRHLGPNDYGLQSYVITIATLAVAISSLGIGSVVTRDLTYEPGEEPAILGSVSGLTVGAALIATLISALWVWFSPPVDHRITWLIVAAVASGIVKRFDFLEAWFVVHDRVRPFAVARITVSVAFLLLRFVLVILRADLETFIWTFVAESVFSGLRALAAYRIATHHAIKWSFKWSISSNMLRRSWPTLVSGITQFIYLKVDVLFLTWWVSSSAAGIYSAAARLSEIWYFVPNMLMSAAFPTLLRLRKSDSLAYKHRLQDILDVLAAAGSIVALAISLSAWFIIPALYGEKFVGAVPILMIHIWAGVFVFMRAVLSKWLIAEELYILSLITHGAGAIINVGCNWLLIPKLGGEGAAIATLVSYATAGYLSLLLDRRTRGMFWMMTKSLFWFRRVPEASRITIKRLRGRT
jgi:O-antigen/teichoic acid export membrane protein